MFDFRADRVTQSVYESLQRLGVSYIDCIQVHDPEFAPSLQIILHETLPALHRLKVGRCGWDVQHSRHLISSVLTHSLSPLDAGSGVMMLSCIYAERRRGQTYWHYRLPSEHSGAAA